MTVGSADQAHEPVETLSRSLFGFALVAWLPLCIAFVPLALAPMSPDPSYAVLQRGIIFGCGLACVVCLLGVIRLYRARRSSTVRLARALHAVVGRRWIAAGLLALLIELNVLGQLILRDIAPAISGPATFLLFCWTLCFAGVVATAQWDRLTPAYFRRRDSLALLGMAIVGGVMLALLALLNASLAESAGVNDWLRGSLDYRPLRFIDDGEAPHPQRFWIEQGQADVRWLPYSYWVLAPFAGEFINVDERGLRETAAQSHSDALPRVYFFGGSTAWGEGARDAYTIPSQVARTLASAAHPSIVHNYAQTGYVSTQDLILFQRQLALGNLPDIAVFYQGFNDVYAAHAPGDMAGLPLGERMRVSDIEAGRLLRRGQPLLRPLPVDMAHINWSLATSGGNSAREIVANWIANRRLIRAAAAEFDVDAIFVWQPALFAKTNLSAFEASIAAELERTNPGFVDLYREVDALLRQAADAAGWDDVLIISDLFGEVDEEIFFDLVHINEIGNGYVAEALAPAIANVLRSR